MIAFAHARTSLSCGQANLFPAYGRYIKSAPNLTPLGDHRRPIMVVSHERSGTHFMVNTLAARFGYVSRLGSTSTGIASTSITSTRRACGS